MISIVAFDSRRVSLRMLNVYSLYCTRSNPRVLVKSACLMLQPTTISVAEITIVCWWNHPVWWRNHNVWSLDHMFSYIFLVKSICFILKSTIFHGEIHIFDVFWWFNHHFPWHFAVPHLFSHPGTAAHRRTLSQGGSRCNQGPLTSMAPWLGNGLLWLVNHGYINCSYLWLIIHNYDNHGWMLI